MRVINERTLQFVEAKHTCKQCSTKFAYNKQDIKQDRDGKYVICPICGQFIDVSDVKLFAY